MDPVTLGMAKADARRRYGRRSEVVGRRPLSLTAAPVMLTPPTVVHWGPATGISSVSIVAAGSGYSMYEVITLTGGSFSAPGKVIVTALGSNGAITGIAVDTPGLYTANATGTVGQATSTGAGTGATFTLGFNGGVASACSDRQSISPTSPVLDFLGNGPASGGGNTVGDNTQSARTFRTDSPIVELHTIAYNTDFQVFVDGQRLALTPWTTDASGSMFYQVLNFGSQRPRTIRVVGFNWALDSIVIQGKASIWKPVLPRRLLAWGLGDSYMFGSGGIDKTAAANCIMAEILGWEFLSDGVGGASWTGSTSGTPKQRVQAKLATLTRVPDIVELDLGYNDAQGNVDPVAITASVNETVAAVRGIAPAATIIGFGPATPIGDAPKLTQVKNILSAAYAPLGVTFIDVSGLVTATNKSAYTDVDNAHPTPAGHAYLGFRKAELVAAALGY